MCINQEDLPKQEDLLKRSHSWQPDDPHKGRLCRQCNAYLPIESFPRQTKRLYTCKNHLNKRIREYRSGKRDWLWRTWNNGYNDATRFFGSKIQISRAELAKLGRIGEINLEKGARVLPLDPTQPWCSENLVLMDPCVRRRVILGWLRSGRDSEKYMIKLGEIAKF
jgi:hypothetical protein